MSRHVKGERRYWENTDAGNGCWAFFVFISVRSSTLTLLECLHESLSVIHCVIAMYDWEVRRVKLIPLPSWVQVGSMMVSDVSGNV